MIDHTGINVSELEMSKEFYQKALAPLAYVVRLEFPGAAGFGARDKGEGDDPAGDFWISSGEPFTPRSHIAFRAASEAAVAAFHEADLAAGGRDNGRPGPRPRYHEGYYAAYVHDPDGYNVEAVHHGGA